MALFKPTPIDPATGFALNDAAPGDPSPGYIPSTRWGGQGITTPEAAADWFLKNLPFGLAGRSGSIDVGVATRGDLARTSKSAKKQQLNCAALDAVIPIPYGRCRLPGLVANVFHLGGDWVFWVIWGEGLFDSFVKITINDADPGGAVVIDSYLGTAEGELNQRLVSCFAERSNGSLLFTETCPGLAYSVIKMPGGRISGDPSFHAEVRGRPVYDPRDNTQVYGIRSTYKWSENPSLILADYLENIYWGAGKTVDWNSVATCADFNDLEFGEPPKQEVSRTCNILVDREADVGTWVETLRTAAAVFLAENQGFVRLVPDVDSAPVAHYDHDAGNIISLSDIKLRDATQLPTVVEVTYTDVSQTPWQDGTTAPVQRAGVNEGTTPFIKSVVEMRWITRASQARREAVERLNKLWLRSVIFNLHVFDEGLSHEPGDIITVSYPSEGFSHLPVRILSAAPTNAGWMFTCEKHDVGCYSTEVQEEPTTLSTNLPLPDAPPAVESVTVVEEVYQLRAGFYASRLRIRWSIPAWPFIKGFRITVWADGVKVLYGEAAKDVDEFVTGTVREQVIHRIDVQMVSLVDAVSTVTSVTFTPLGKYLPPGVVPWVKGLEAGGTVHLWWGEADDIDIWRYETRYGPVGGSWDDAVFLDRVDGLTQVYNGLPAGAWVFYVSAIDSVRQYSPYPTTVNVTITLDTGDFLVSNHLFDNVNGKTLTNMTEVVFRDGSRVYVTDFGDLINYGHTNINDAVGTFVDASGLVNEAFDTPHTPGTSEFITEAWDIGTVISGTVSFDAVFTVESGDVDVFIETKESIGDAWTVTAGSPAAIAACRYIRGRLSSTGSFTVTESPSASISAKTKTENFTDLTSNANGPKTITLARVYTKAKSILVTAYLPDPPAARTWAVDNVQLGGGVGDNTFDIYIFDAAGNQVASDFSVQFQGI